jgi:hypothetical protein
MLKYCQAHISSLALELTERSVEAAQNSLARLGLRAQWRYGISARRWERRWGHVAV